MVEEESITVIKMPLVSVIIATYNRSGMLRRSVGSVLNQTFHDFELLVVSDGSTDDTRDVVNSFDDPRIRFFENEKNKGYPVARNIGLVAARGEYIAFLDDDDEWFPQKLALQVSLIKKLPTEVGLIYAWSEYLHGGDVVKVHTPELRGNIFPEMLGRQAIGTPSSILFKKEVIYKVGLLDTFSIRGSDGTFFKKVSKNFLVDYVPEILVKVYIGHVDRITVDSVPNLEAALKTLEYRLEIFKEDYCKYQIQKSNVIIEIIKICLRIGDIKKGMKYIKMLLSSEIRWNLKINICFFATKDITKILVKDRIVKIINLRKLFQDTIISG